MRGNDIVLPLLYSVALHQGTLFKPQKAYLSGNRSYK